MILSVASERGMAAQYPITHPAGAGCLGDEVFGFRIIDAAQLILIVEVLDRAAMLDKSQALTVEREVTGDRPSTRRVHKTPVPTAISRRGTDGSNPVPSTGESRANPGAYVTGHHWPNQR